MKILILFDEKLQELCEVLQEDPTYLEYDIIPSQKQMDLLAQSIQALEQEKVICLLIYLLILS